MVTILKFTYGLCKCSKVPKQKSLSVWKTTPIFPYRHCRRKERSLACIHCFICSKIFHQLFFKKSLCKDFCTRLLLQLHRDSWAYIHHMATELIESTNAQPWPLLVYFCRAYKTTLCSSYYFFTVSFFQTKSLLAKPWGRSTGSRWSLKVLLNRNHSVILEREGQRFKDSWLDGQIPQKNHAQQYD